MSRKAEGCSVEQYETEIRSQNRFRQATQPDKRPDLGLLKTIDDKRTCVEIPQQVVAVRSALDQLDIALLAEHVQTGLLHQGAEHPEDRWRELSEEGLVSGDPLDH